MKVTEKISENALYVASLAKAARSAAKILGTATTRQKNQALEAIARTLDEQRAAILEANHKDMAAAVDLDSALLDRLSLDDDRIDAMIAGLTQIISLPDPVGSVEEITIQPSGIEVGKMRVPLGVIGIIYESRPNVTIDAAALCLKSGNACLLRGGSEAIHSNTAIAACITQGLKAAGLAPECVQVLARTDREIVDHLIQSSHYLDVIIPRGGKGLIKHISEVANVPVIKHLDGICHTYIDAEADVEMSIKIAFNAKTRRYGVCNAMETLLVHEAIAEQVLPELARLYQEKGVELRGCPKTCALIKGIRAAQAEDWATEYLDAILSIRVVDNMAQAMAHIAEYGSGHTDAIVSQNYVTTRQFVRTVDSASVVVNASTGFADGFEYGLGAEIGISTDKFHVRGPVGLEGLTSQKFVVYGEGHIRP